MYPVIPFEAMTASWEVICCFFTAIGAVLGWLLTMRG